MSRKTMTHTECVACGCMLMPLNKWRHMTVEQRRVFTELGGRAHEGRGLCRIDYHQARRDGTLIDYERTTVPLELVLEEWDRLHDSGMNLARNTQLIAPRLGMTPKALEQALVRAGIRNPVAPAVSRKGLTDCGDCQRCSGWALALAHAERAVTVAARRAAHRDTPANLADLEDMRAELQRQREGHQFHQDTEHAEDVAA